MVLLHISASKELCTCILIVDIAFYVAMKWNSEFFFFFSLNNGARVLQAGSEEQNTQGANAMKARNQ